MRNFAIALTSLVALTVLTTVAAHAAVTGSLTITSVVHNGPAHPSDFTLEIRNGNSIISASGNTLVLSGLTAGTYTIRKTEGPSGYSVVWSGDCSPQGTVTIIPTVMRNCTATYVLGSVGTLQVNTVVKGGPALVADLPVHIKKSGEPDTGSPSGSGSTVTFDSLLPGTYTVVPAPAPEGYTRTFSGACNSQGTVTVQGDKTVTCTVTYTFSTSGSGGSRPERPVPTRPPR